MPRPRCRAIHRLLVPKTEERRVIPCWVVVGGSVGSACPGDGETGGVGGSVWSGFHNGFPADGVGVTTARGASSATREDMPLNSSRIGHLAFSAATCTHSIKAQFFATRRCAFMSPSR